MRHLFYELFKVLNSRQILLVNSICLFKWQEEYKGRLLVVTVYCLQSAKRLLGAQLRLIRMETDQDH